MQAYSLSASFKLHKKLIKQQFWAQIETLPALFWLVKASGPAALEFSL